MNGFAVAVFNAVASTCDAFEATKHTCHLAITMRQLWLTQAFTLLHDYVAAVNVNDIMHA